MSNENGGHHVAGPARCWRSAAGTCTGNDSHGKTLSYWLLSLPVQVPTALADYLAGPTQ